MDVTRKDFFISYTAHDRQWAEWIAWELEEAQFTVQIQAWDFTGNWVLLMNRAMTETARTIAVLSPHYFESGYTPAEWAEAFRRDPKGEKDLLIPVRIAPVELQGIFAQLTYVDLVGLSESTASERLLHRVRGERGKPATRPSYPGQRTIATKPPYPAFDEDTQRLIRARELLVRWRGAYAAREEELRAAERKAHEWRFRLPAAVDEEVIAVIDLAARVSTDLRALPVEELEFARPYGLDVHPTVFSDYAHNLVTGRAIRKKPWDYGLENVERVLHSAVAMLHFALDDLPRGYVPGVAPSEDLRSYGKLFVALLNEDPRLQLMSVDDGPKILGEFAARKLELTPHCARRTREGTIDLVATDRHYVYVWSQSGTHPSAQYERGCMVLSAAFVPEGIVLVDFRGTIRHLESGKAIHTEEAKLAVMWVDPLSADQWRAVLLTKPYGLLSQSFRAAAVARSPESLWKKEADDFFWYSLESLFATVLAGFPCVVVHRTSSEGMTLHFLDPISLQSLRAPMLLHGGITSVTLAGGRWLVAFSRIDEEESGIEMWDLRSDQLASQWSAGEGDAYSPVVSAESSDAFEILFVRYRLKERILCRFRWPPGKIEELATYSELSILRVAI